jgi:hypothetical protein
VRRMIGWLKETVTYPRTGYVVYPRRQGLRRGWRIALGMAVGGMVAGAAAVLASRAAEGLAVMPMVSGVLLGVVMMILGWRSRLARFYILALLSAAAGLALGLGGLEDEAAITLYYLAFSLILFASGGLTLWSYLRRTASPQPE